MDAPVPPRTQEERERWWHRFKTRVQTWLFGYDFFIAYRQADGSVCARSLESKLKRRFDCFLDERHYEAGHNLPQMQTQALRRSRKLLVVVSPLAHRVMTQGTDWLLAEVLEFKHLAAARDARAVIVPIGTERTLTPRLFPESKLLREIPSLDTDTVCIYDEAVERNAEIGPRTIEKLTNDFKEVRRRQVRRISSVIALVAIAGAFVLAAIAETNDVRAQRIAKTEKAFRLLDRGGPVSDDPGGALLSYQQSLSLFTELGLDPLMPLHGLLAERLYTLQTDLVGSVEGEVDSITVSQDGEWLLVIYDYQAPNGSPEPNEILDSTAFGVFHIRSRKWTRKEPLRTPAGQALYATRVDAFEPPNHVVVPEFANGVTKFRRVSLLDGTSMPIDGYQARRTPSRDTTSGRDKLTPAQQRLQRMLANERLFVVPPEDGIDVEYGTRLVDKTYEVSPDGRSALVGTYEGRLFLVDLPTGLKRGETKVGSIFAAAYRSDSARAYVADETSLYEVQTGGWPGVFELRAPEPSSDMTTLAATIADDGSMIALATTRRLMALSPSAKQWRTWDLPRPVKKAAALRVDPHRSRIDFVAADDGTIVSADYRSPGSRVDTVPNPNGSEASVAWIDAQTASVWMTASRWSKHLRSVPLPGGSAKAADVPLPLDPHSGLGIHAIAKIEDEIVVFHGDERDYDDRTGALDDEQMLRISLTHRAIATNHVVFAAKTFRNGPDPFSICTQVSTVLSDSKVDDVRIVAGSDGVYTIGTDGKPKQRSRQFLSLHHDGEQSYEIGISGKQSDRWLDVRHSSTRASVRYQLPWSLSGEPKFVAVTQNGRRVMLASEEGNVMLLDVEK